MSLHALEPMHRSAAALRRAGLLLRKSTPSDSYLLTDEPYILHYADRTGTCLEAGSYDALVRLVPENASHVVLALRNSNMEAAKERNPDLTFTPIEAGGEGPVSLCAVARREDATDGGTAARKNGR